ncbi:MAG: hypothetical protein DMG06_15975 [Acidobacteria bacterium]|nr:MAG: hypothetical protein DMG06_15975 [Acidobacteriota bacterium]
MNTDKRGLNESRADGEDHRGSFSAPPCPTFGHPVQMAAGQGVRGWQTNKIDQSLNFFATK